MSSCWIIPQVTNKNGQIVDSKLFQDLYNISGHNRPVTIDIYSKIKNPEFTDRFGDKIVLDNNNEPTIESLYKTVDLQKYIDKNVLKDNITKQFKFGEENTFSNPEEAFQKAVEFNTYGAFKKDFIAFSKNNQVILYNTNEQREELFNQMIHDYELNKRLKSILQKAGVGIEIINNVDENIFSGSYDPTITQKRHDDLIYAIKISQNEELTGTTLSEEFSHALINNTKDSNPLVERLIQTIEKNNLAPTILGESYNKYADEYEDDSTRLNLEAAGKLLSNTFHQSKVEGSPVYRNLLQRVVDYFKNLFRKVNFNDVENAYKKAKEISFELTREVLDDEFSWNYDPSKTIITKPLYNLEKPVDLLAEKLKNIYGTELKRYHMEKNNTIDKFETMSKESLFLLEDLLKEKQYLLGIELYIKDALQHMNNISDNLNKLAKGSFSSPNESAFLLRQANNYVNSYKLVQDDLYSYINAQRLDSKLTPFSEQMKGQLDLLGRLINEVSDQYQTLSRTKFAKFLSQFMGPEVLEKVGKIIGRKNLNIEDLLKTGNSDIKFIDRWIDSLSYSKDIILSLYGKIINRSKTRSRQRALELSKRIKAMQFKLEDAGYKNTDWMLKRDEEGKLTGYIIQKNDIYKYNKDKKQKLKELSAKYPNYVTNGIEGAKFNEEYTEWKKTAMEEDKQFLALSSAQREYYDEWIDIKQELELLLPENVRNTYVAPQIRKQFVERVKNSSSFKEGSIELWEGIKDQWIRREDDTEFGDKQSLKARTIKDFEGREILSLPIYYVNFLEDMTHLSTDVSSTLLAYGSMAFDYFEMNQIVNSLELGKDVLRRRKLGKQRGGKDLQEEFVEMNKSVSEPLTTEGDNTAMMQKLTELLEYQVYHRHYKDQGTVGDTNIDVNKASKNIAKYTVLVGLALHWLNDIANTSTNIAMTNTEAIGGEHFSAKDLFNADKKYWRDIRKHIPQIGSRNQTSKLALWIEKFNVLQDFDRDVNNAELYKKTKASRLFNSSLLFFLRSIGEHWMNTRVSLAIAERIQLVDKNGNKVSLYDAYEVENITKGDRVLGARLILRPDLIKENWIEISKKNIFTQKDLDFIKNNGVVTNLTIEDENFQDQMSELVNKYKHFNEEDIETFTRKANTINNFLNGDKGTDYKGAFQRTAQGKLAMIYRSWMRNTYAKRWADRRYIAEADIELEGFYKTLFRFLKEVKDMQFHVAATWHTLSKSEKANVRRAIAELSQLVLVILAVGLIDWKGDDDEDEESWLMNMIEFQLRRNITEVGVVTPTPYMITEFIRIIKSPTAAINVTEDILALPKMLLPSSWTERKQSGIHKGWLKGLDYGSKALPGMSGISKFFDPGTSAQFYKSNR